MTRHSRTLIGLPATVLLAHVALIGAPAAAQDASAPQPDVAPRAPEVTPTLPPPPLPPLPPPPSDAPGVPDAALAPHAPQPVVEPAEAPSADALPPPPEGPPAEPVPAEAPAEPMPVAEPPTQSTGFLTQDGAARRKVAPIFDVGSYHCQASGYVQGQYQKLQQSEDELSADGLRLRNQTGFFVPRARIVVEGSNKWSAAVLEYDIANVNSQFLGMQRAEATLHVRNPRSAVPFVATTLGLFRTPFGAEAALSARLRYYADNATVTQAFFPGQSDLGFRAEGGIAWFRYAVAFVNGHPINEPRWGGRAPTRQGDVLGRLGVDADLGFIHIVAGASALKGRGFSPGTAASKDAFTARDVAETGVVTPNSVTLVPGRAATASQTFERWATGVDGLIDVAVGSYWNFTLRGEFMFGSNIDRGLFIADPIALGYDSRSYGAVGSFDNLIYQVGLLGFRYDVYDPNPDGTSSVGARVVKTSRAISTATILAGVQLPGTNTRLFAEFNRVKDHLGLGLDGRPADIKNNRFLLRLQVALW